ncbi:MAG TPA: hypothetical protein VJ966_14080 [Actinomycetes bacterium]|nr:hypothetical protein [Actinomycetes bacterium]
MDLPTDLVTLASDSDLNRLYHQEIHARLPTLGLPTTIAAGASGHEAHHEAIHAQVGGGLPTNVVIGAAGHAGHHNIIHAALNARPIPGPEPFPATSWPPAATSSLTGVQTTQYRPDSQSNRKFDLKAYQDATHAKWSNAPGTLQYPMVINQSGGLGNGTNTWHFGGEIAGTDLTNDPRDVQYAHTSGIEHTGNSTAGYLVGDSLVVSNIGDGYRFVDKGVAYLKRIWARDLRDGFVEFDELTGDAFIYDCLVEGCYSGISDIGSGTNSAKTLTVDGLLLHLKPTVDTPQAQGGTWCGGTGGCNELNGVWSDGRYRGSNGIWEGDSGSYGTVIVRNSWFRLDRYSAWGPAPMMWPGQAGAQWNNSATLTIGDNVKVLWTGMDRSFNPTSAAYPGPTLPAGITLVTGSAALSMWNAAAAAWKTAHGY